MRGKRLLILALLAMSILVGGGYLIWKRTRDSEELDRLIAALPRKRAPRPAPARIPPGQRGSLPPARLIELLEEANGFGAGGTLGERSWQIALGDVILTEFEERLADELLSPEDRQILREALRADLARDPDWTATLRAHRYDWLRWLARLREGGEQDENEVLGPPTESRRLLGGRRIADDSIMLGWRAIERFYDRIEEIPLAREDFEVAFDACVEVPPAPREDPLTAYFATYATCDLVFTRDRVMEYRSREERLLRSLE